MATETTTESVALPVEPRPLESLSPKQYDEWRLTGNIPNEEPAAKEQQETPPAATETEREAPKQASAGREATTQEPSSLHKLGYRELRQQVRELKAENQRLKTAPRTTDTQLEPVAEVTTTTTRPEQEAAGKERPKPTPHDLDPKGQPKFKTYEDYLEDLTDWKTEVRFAAYQKEQAEKAAKEATERQQKAITNRWTEQINAAKGKHADFDTVALNPNLAIPPGSAVEQWILDSDIGTEMLYYFGQHPDELAQIHRMRPVEAARHLTAIEAELSEPPTPKEKTPAIEVRNTTKAPPPAREVGGRGSAAVDEVSKAVADDDFTAFKNAANRQDIAKHKR